MMTTRTLASLAAIATVAFAGPAFAQTATGPMTSDEAVGAHHPATPEIGHDDRDALLNSHGVSYSLGWRVWAMYVPQPIVNLFVRNIAGANGNANQNNWPGGLNIATGPEFVYRKDNLDIALSLMYVGYFAPAGYFHGTNEGPDATEVITSNLMGFYATSHFLWGIRVHRMFEIQIGVGIGIGYIGGQLTRVQANETSPGQWSPCSGPGAGSFCGNDNSHYGNYVEPSWAGGGNVPLVLPWISVPQVGFHFRPHRNFDIRADVGYALIGIYGGASLHYIF